MICAWHKSAIICHDGFPSSTVCAGEGALGTCANKTQPGKHMVWMDEKTSRWHE